MLTKAILVTSVKTLCKDLSTKETSYFSSLVGIVFLFLNIFFALLTKKV